MADTANASKSLAIGIVCALAVTLLRVSSCSVRHRVDDDFRLLDVAIDANQPDLVLKPEADGIYGEVESLSLTNAAEIGLQPCPASYGAGSGQVFCAIVPSDTPTLDATVGAKPPASAARGKSRTLPVQSLAPITLRGSGRDCRSATLRLLPAPSVLEFSIEHAKRSCELKSEFNLRPTPGKALELGVVPAATQRETGQLLDGPLELEGGQVTAVLKAPGRSRLHLRLGAKPTHIALLSHRKLSQLSGVLNKPQPFDVGWFESCGASDAPVRFQGIMLDKLELNRDSGMLHAVFDFTEAGGVGCGFPWERLQKHFGPAPDILVGLVVAAMAFFRRKDAEPSADVCSGKGTTKIS